MFDNHDGGSVVVSCHSNQAGVISLLHYLWLLSPQKVFILQMGRGGKE
jgi:hypothetical protein